MKSILKSALVAGALLGATALGAGTALAMPRAGMDVASDAGVDLVQYRPGWRQVCNPFGCRWVRERYVEPRRRDWHEHDRDRYRGGDRDRYERRDWR